MSRRRQRDSEDSLELLLDTISNAFGGIMFITILVTLLLKLSHASSDTPKVSDAARYELMELSRQLESVLAELKSLDSALAMQTEARKRLTNPDMKDAHDRLMQQRGQRVALVKSILEVRQAAGDEQRQIDDFAARSEELQQAMNRARGEIRRAHEKLREERKHRTQSIVPPRGRTSTKQEFCFIIRYGRVYQPWRWDSAGLMRERNWQEFVVIEERGGEVHITPKPYKGVPIDGTPAFAQDLRSQLAGHPPGSWYVCVAIWEDSFEKFGAIKQLLIDWNYDVRIVPVEEGGRVHEGYVPHPQVQ